MSGSNRSYVLALVGWLILAAAPAPNNSTNAKQSQPSPNVERSLQTIANAQARQAETGEYQAPCGNGEYNNRSDLCAQWYAARAARDAADWAFWALLAGIVSAVGVVAALILTAASNRIASRTARLQLRPYVLPIKPRVKRSKGGAVGSWDMKIRVRNGGVTPAENVRCQVEGQYVKLPLPRDLPPISADPIQFAYIGPQETRFIASVFRLSAAREAALRRLEAAIFVRTRIEYHFFEGERDEVTHDYMIVGIDLDTGRVRVVPEWAYNAKPDEDDQKHHSPPSPAEEPGE